MNTVLERSEFKNIFGTDLATPQDIVFNSMMNLDYMAFRLPRGAGKDFLLSTYAMLYAASTAKSRILIVAPVYRQVKILFKVIERFSLKSIYFEDLCLEKPINRHDAYYLKFKNGSIIEATSFWGNIPGCNDAIVLVTEADGMPKQRLSELVEYVESNTLRKVFLMSAGYYDHNYMNEIEAHECFSTLAFGYKAFSTGFYNQANIKNARETLSADIFDMEYNSKICKLLKEN